MPILQHRSRSKANASLISMMQRFSDIFTIFFGLYIVSYLDSEKFSYFHMLMALTALVIFQMIGGITDFYRSWRGVKFSTELNLILQNWSLSIIFAAGLLSFLNDYDFTLNKIFRWYLFVCIGFMIFRILIRYVARGVRKLGYNTRRVAVAGSMPVGVNLLRSFQEEPWIGFSVSGVYNDELVELDDIPYCGDFCKLIEDAKNGKLDRIYIAMSMGDELKLKELVKKLTNTTCSVMLIPDVFTFNILQSRIEEVNGVPVVPLFDTPMNGINMVFKRLEDLIISSIIILLISPVLLAIALAVKISSPGPIIFRQVRYGIDGKPIKVFKFRSMNVMENGGEVVQAKKNDSRVTKVGSFLRKTSLDELPQFFNVITGQMSIVGPRPHAVAHNEQYRDLIEGYMLRHKVKPGITGWAQINGWRGETDTLEKMQKRVEYDLAYIRDWSIWFDLKIIFLTVFKGFINKSAY
ncbi:undecaprenyl-phosphate glucose phosphotransferase [Raoultella ornithinolytica]|uniref:undecaprenyl-phosphate glucose phosphotransferase n=1 Tax=Raoultella ornithinolytica TaxID=54291 RepID=UPI00255B33A7|nr:undecaprenyl-phosphate glucose phosphotransferase [Raoultella ornithinolytica]MDL4583443.1 undecaprenyl-phosphate glucose phosphotransferase [Raoultella ornithinolytica]HCH7883648.1 undecaprenyl-phosphate glucose phosphotransferase [Raoultella ornithinolytica]HDH7797338.1 undecaprenyl-phosphate glucose phosphotransferase [Raoultella ornithinolytica]